MPADVELERLTRAVAPKVAALARQLCGRAAADGSQEVFRELARAWPGFRGEAAPTTWAHRIAVRTLLRFADRERRHERRQPTAAELRTALDQTVVDAFAAEPFTALAAAERRRAVHAAVLALSPPLRDVLVLRAIEGLDYAQIAAELDLPLGTVKSRIAAATLRLAERLQPHGDPR